MLNRSEVPPTTLHIAPYMLPLYLAKPDDAILVAAGALVQDELLVVGARLPVSVGDAEVDAHAKQEERRHAPDEEGPEVGPHDLLPNEGAPRKLEESRLRSDSCADSRGVVLKEWWAEEENIRGGQGNKWPRWMTCADQQPPRTGASSAKLCRRLPHGTATV
jgi:hypothetical protein